MQDKLKKLEKALRIVRIINTVAAVLIGLGFFGILAAAGGLEHNQMPWPAYIIVSAISLGIILFGSKLLDTVAGRDTKLKKAIDKAQRQAETEPEPVKAYSTARFIEQDLNENQDDDYFWSR